jgi:heme exporter protein B
VSLVSETVAVLHKDFLLDWRGKRRALAVGLFGATTLLLFSFATGPDGAALARHAAGYVWLALLLSSTVALNESFRVELEDDALEGLSLLPVDPRALFYGKALANSAFLVFLSFLLVPLAMVMYGVGIQGSPWMLLALLVAGIAGLAGPGTLYSAMSSRARGRDVMLPLLLYPLVIPVILAVVKGTQLAFAGDPMNQGTGWLQLVVAFDVVYWSLCGVLFGKVVDS